MEKQDQKQNQIVKETPPTKSAPGKSSPEKNRNQGEVNVNQDNQKNKKGDQNGRTTESEKHSENNPDIDREGTITGNNKDPKKGTPEGGGHSNKEWDKKEEQNNPDVTNEESEKESFL